jgi:hypothetical protein
MSLPILERVMHLVRLAGSDNDNEARNAAMEVCRLIREHKLRVSVPPNFVRTSPPGNPIVNKEGIGERTARAAREILDRVAHPGADIPWPDKRPSPSAPATPPLNRPRPVVMVNSTSTPVQIKAKWPGNCEDCHRPYVQGDTVWYRRGIGCVHAACDPGALV